MIILARRRIDKGHLSQRSGAPLVYVSSWFAARHSRPIDLASDQR